MRKFINRILFLCNCIFAICMVLSNWADSINPNTFVFFSYLGLAFPIWTLINVMFLFYWAILRKKYFFVPLLALLFSYQNIISTFPLNIDKQTPQKGIKILSYNALLMNEYAPLNKNKVLKYLTNSKADIICIQEYGYAFNDHQLSKDDIQKALGKEYPYQHINIIKNGKRGMYGLATFSKFPITKKQKVNFNSIFSDILYQGDTLRVFNCHLESNRLTRSEAKIISQIGKDIENSKLAYQLSKKLGRSYRRRAEQADEIAAFIKKSHHPTIVCGDFNDVIVSYSYKTLLADCLTDSHKESGIGYDNTFHEHYFYFKIDHILHSKNIDSHNFKVDKVNGSDHYPIHCTLTFPKNQKKDRK